MLKELTSTHQLRLNQDTLKKINEYAEKHGIVNDINNELNISKAVRVLIKNALEYDELMSEYKENPEKLNDLVIQKQKEREQSSNLEWIKRLEYSQRASLLKLMREIQDEEYDKRNRKLGSTF